MVWYCRKCGRKLSDFIKMCPDCKIRRDQPPPSSGRPSGGGGGGDSGSGKSRIKIIERIREKKDEAGGGVISALVVMLLVTATLVWFYFSPIDDAFMDILVIWFPNIADTWQNTYIFLAAVAILVLTLEALTSKKIRMGLYFVIVFWILIFTYYIVPPFLEIFEVEVGNYWATLICTLKMEDMESCMGMVDGEEPEIEKEGDYVALEAEFRTEYAGKEIYKITDEETGLIQLNFDSYFIDMEFKNPSDTKAITGFSIISCDGPECIKGSYIKRAGSLKTVGKHIIASLQTTNGDYMKPWKQKQNNNCPPGGCVINPGETLRLTFKVGENFMEDLCDGTDARGCERVDFCAWDESTTSCNLGNDMTTEEVEARIMYEYDYSAEGKWDFIVAESNEILEPQLRERGEPRSSSGPVDVKVVFSPTAYVNRVVEEEPPQIGLVVKLEKEEDGSVAFIDSPIKVIRLTGYNGILTKVEDDDEESYCTAPWTSKIPFKSEWEGEPKDDLVDFIDLGLSQYDTELRDTHTYFCNFKIDVTKIGEDGKEVIPFIVRVNYRHQKIMTQRFIDVVGYNV
jgi:hypothetical protein